MLFLPVNQAIAGRHAHKVPGAKTDSRATISLFFRAFFLFFPYLSLMTDFFWGTILFWTVFHLGTILFLDCLLTVCSIRPLVSYVSVPSPRLTFDVTNGSQDPAEADKLMAIQKDLDTTVVQKRLT